MSSNQPKPVNSKELLLVEDVGNRQLEVSASSINRSASFFSDIGSDFEADDSNFLVRVDSFHKKKGLEEVQAYNGVKDILKERGNTRLDEQITSGQKAECSSGKAHGKENKSVADKENMQTKEECSTLSDLNLFIPPPPPPKKFVKPMLPSILELSYEEGKALSLTSRSSSESTILDYVDAVHKQDLIVDPCSSMQVADRSYPSAKSIQPDPRSKFTNGHFHDSIKPTSTSRSYPDLPSCLHSEALVDQHVKPDSWDEFDKVMEESFVAEDFPRFKELSINQRDLELDDAGFKSFTSLEAQELMDKDEAERLQLLTSVNGTFSESFNNSNEGGAGDTNMSMGTYFKKRSSAPFKISDFSFSEIINKMPSRDSIFQDSDVQCGSTSAYTNHVKDKNLSLSESFQSMYENDENEPLKLPDTSLDTLGKFFMGPQSSYLTGNHQGMMEYILDYCRQKADKTLPSDREQINVEGADPNDRNENLRLITRRSSENSSGVFSSYEPNKSLTPVNEALPPDPASCNKTYGKHHISELDDQSVVIAGHGLSGPSFGISESILEMENTFDLARYAKFEENLKKSMQEGSTQLNRHSEREIKLKYPVPIRSNSDKNPNSVTASVLKQLSLELLRNDSLSPPERLNTPTYRKTSNVVSTLNNNSGGASSTPVQEQSLSASLAKELGLGHNIASSYIPPLITKEPLESCNDAISVRPIVGEYNFVKRDKQGNLHAVGNHLTEVKNSTTIKPSSTNYSTNECGSGTENPILNNLNRFKEYNVAQHVEDDFKCLTSSEAQMMLEKDEGERERAKILTTSNANGTHLKRFGTSSSSFTFPKTNPYVNQNQVPNSNAVAKLSKETKCTDSSVQTSFLQPKSTATSSIPLPSFNDGGNVNQIVQSQNFGYPLIIQIHCACSGGVNVATNQTHPSAFVQPVITNQSHQKCIESPSQALQSQEPIPLYKSSKPEFAAQNLRNNNLVPIPKELIQAEKEKQGPQSAFIEVDKMSLVWGFVDFGQTEVNTVCLSNKQNSELRFRAIIVEKSYLKNFKFVLDPSDVRIKETERVGVLPPFASKQLKVSYSPQTEGTISGSIHLRFHTVPYTDLGFKGEIPLIVRGTYTAGSQKDNNTSRAGDDIKIRNTNLNFGKVIVGNTSRKVSNITNNGTSTAKFIVSPRAYNGLGDGESVDRSPFISSVFEGTIAKGASREIIFTYRPANQGKHCQNWSVDVTFVYSSIQMTKTTTIVLEGEGVKLE